MRAHYLQHVPFEGLGRHVIGLQFHPEATSESVRTMMKECRDELIPGVSVQSQEEILGASPEWFETGNTLSGFYDILDVLLCSVYYLQKSV